MNALPKKLGQLFRNFSPAQSRKQAQVSQMIRRWVTEEEKRQKPRLYKAPIKKNTFGDSGYVLLIIPATAFGLGCWQVRRREWKLGLIDQLEKRTTAEPIEIPEDYQELLVEEMQYRRVRVRGHFDHSKEIYLGPRSNINVDSGAGLMSQNAQTGVNIITPLKVTDRNLTILVNRGWVPMKKKNPATRKDGQVEGEVELVGIIRHSEKRAPLTPKDKGTPEIWLRRNAEKMAAITGADPILIDADMKSTVPGGPVGGQTRVSLRNEHVSYIITWYSLAFFTAWMWYRRYRQPPPPDKAAFIARRPGGPL